MGVEITVDPAVVVAMSHVVAVAIGFFFGMRVQQRRDQEFKLEMAERVEGARARLNAKFEVIRQSIGDMDAEADRVAIEADRMFGERMSVACSWVEQALEVRPDLLLEIGELKVLLVDVVSEQVDEADPGDAWSIYSLLGDLKAVSPEVEALVTEVDAAVREKYPR